MDGWFNWRTAVGSIVLGLAFAVLLFTWNEQQFTLSGLDLFFAVTTAVSVGFNLWQLFRDRYKYAPVSDTLIGLFNDLKGRQQRTYQRQLLITSHAGMALPLEAVRLEFYDFVNETTQALEQLREHVVAAIHIVDPSVSTQQIFRAAEFGLSERERRFREEDMESFRQNWVANAQRQAQARAQAAPGTNATPGA